MLSTNHTRTGGARVVTRTVSRIARDDGPNAAAVRVLPPPREADGAGHVAPAEVEAEVRHGDRVEAHGLLSAGSSAGCGRIRQKQVPQAIAPIGGHRYHMRLAHGGEDGWRHGIGDLEEFGERMAPAGDSKGAK